MYVLGEGTLRGVSVAITGGITSDKSAIQAIDTLLQPLKDLCTSLQSSYHFDECILTVFIVNSM